MKDLQRLDLNLLKALDALLDERSVTRAAQRLGVSQPAMSAMLTRLRDSFKDELFVRASRGIVATTRAVELAGPLKSVLQHAAALLQPTGFDPAQTGRHFTLAATDYAFHAIAVPLLSAIKPLAPRLRLSLVPLQASRWYHQLEQGELDMVLGTPDITPDDLHALHLFDEYYVCAMRAGHPALAGRASLDLDTFCTLDHALVSYSGRAFEGITDQALQKLGRQRNITLTLQSFVVLPDILRSSDLVAVVPRRLMHGFEDMAILAPPLTLPGFSKSLLWHPRQHQDPAHQWLRRQIHAACHDRDQGSAPPMS